MFDWSWQLKDLNPDKDVKVFTTFSCGGVAPWDIKELDFKS